MTAAADVIGAQPEECIVLEGHIPASLSARLHVSLPGLKVTPNGFASLKIDKKVIEKYKVDAGTASNLVNNFNHIEEILCWALVSYDEKLKIHKVNIRSRGPVINEVASKHNGGGHPRASGARIKNAKDIDKLFKDLDVACREYKKKQKEKSQ